MGCLAGRLFTNRSERANDFGDESLGEPVRLRSQARRSTAKSLLQRFEVAFLSELAVTHRPFKFPAFD